MKINQAELIRIRRALHQIPEISLQEFKTSQYIKDVLDAYGIEYVPVSETGVLATVKGKQEGNRVLGMRCDMDGLPVYEETGLSYRSQHEGCMHACGHDAHMAVQLVVAKWFHDHRESFGGTLKFIFQPAEECVKGAKLFIESGVVEDVESFYGMHIWNDLPVGTVNIEEGPRMGSVDMFKIHVKGKGGHGSAPHQCVDALVVAAQILLSLQTFVSREIDPKEQVVLSVGKIAGGTACNVIAEKAVLEGTIRGFNNALRKEYKPMLERIASHIAAAYRAQVEVEYEEGAPVLVNDQALALMGAGAIGETLGEKTLVHFERITASEDFAEFAQYKPSVFAFIGCRNEEKDKVYPHHNPKFDIDEDCLEVAAKVAISFGLKYLNS